MAVAFPDLERSSAVGEEGRPRSTSLGVGAVTVFTLAIAAGVLSGQPTSAVSTATFTAVLVAGLALLERDRFGLLFVGTMMSVVGGSVTVLSILLLLARTEGWIMLGLAVAIVGVGLTWVNLGNGSDTTAARAVGGGYIGIVVGAVGVVVAVGAGLALLDAGTADPVSTTATFLFLCSLLGVSLYALLRAAPIVQLTPRPRRAVVDRRVTLARRVVIGGAAAAFLAILATPYVAPTLAFAPLLGSPVVRLPIFMLTGVASVLAVVASMARRLAHSRSEHSRRQIAGVAAGALLGAVLLVLPVPLPATFVLVALLVVVPIVLLFAVGLVSFLGSTRFAPARGGSLALASGGLVIATLGAGLAGYPGPFVLACAAGAAVVWDVSTFGAGLTAELGHVPDTRDLELVHAVTVLGIGVCAVLVGSGVLWLRSSVGPIGSTAAMGLGAVAALLVLLPLRG